MNGVEERPDYSCAKTAYRRIEMSSELRVLAFPATVLLGAFGAEKRWRSASCTPIPTLYATRLSRPSAHRDSRQTADFSGEELRLPQVALLSAFTTRWTRAALSQPLLRTLEAEGVVFRASRERPSLENVVTD